MAAHCEQVLALQIKNYLRCPKHTFTRIQLFFALSTVGVVCFSSCMYKEWKIFCLWF